MSENEAVPAACEWQIGSIAIAREDYRLEIHSKGRYVVNQIRRDRPNLVYLKIINDRNEVAELLASMFALAAAPSPAPSEPTDKQIFDGQVAYCEATGNTVSAMVIDCVLRAALAAPVPPTPLSANAKQDAVQAAVDLYRTWKENAATHGGNLHLLMQRIYDLFRGHAIQSNPLANENARLKKALKDVRRYFVDGYGTVAQADMNIVAQIDAAIAVNKGDENGD